jgi:hypothetical protein
MKGGKLGGVRVSNLGWDFWDVTAYLGGRRRVRVVGKHQATDGEQIHYHYRLRGLSTTFCS